MNRFQRTFSLILALNLIVGCCAPALTASATTALPTLEGDVLYSCSDGSTTGWQQNNNNDIRSLAGKLNGTATNYTIWPLGPNKPANSAPLQVITPAFTADSTDYNSFRACIVSFINNTDPALDDLALYYSTDSGSTWTSAPVTMTDHGKIWSNSSGTNTYSVYSFTTDSIHCPSSAITNMMIKPYGETGGITTGAFRLISLQIKGTKLPDSPRNDTTYIQDLIDTAAANGQTSITVPSVNPADGTNVYQIGTAIELPSNMTVYLDNCTLRLNDGVLCNIFISKGCYNTSMTAEEEVENIKIIGIGNAVLDGGNHNGVTESTATKPDGFKTTRYNTSIYFRNVNGFEVKNLTIKEPRYWGMTYIFSRNGTISGIDFDCSGKTPNQDGIDLRIGCNNIVIDDITGVTGDDTVALTALSTEGGTDAWFSVTGKDRHIHDVTISNVKATCNGGHGIIRLLAHHGNQIYNIHMENIEDTSTSVHVKGVLRIGDTSYAGSGTPMEYGDMYGITIDGVISNGEYAIYVGNSNVTSKHLTYENVTNKYGQITNLIVEVPPGEEPKVGVFDPENCGGMAYCDACIAQGVATEDALVKWTAYNGENYSESTVLTDKQNGSAHFHLYLDGDKTYASGTSFLISHRKVCFNLNGHNITADAGAKHTFGVTQVLNIFDSEGGAVVTGNNASATSGSALHLNGGNASGTYNIYGGTFTKLADSAGPVFMIGGNGGKANMYGGTIDATGKSSTNGAAVFILGHVDTDLTDTKNRNASFTMYGGEIKGGTATKGGAICVGGSGANYAGCATFNLQGGTISGGSAGDGGNIYIRGNTMNMTGGTISGGIATTNAGNVLIEDGGTLNMSGGKIVNGTAGNQAGNIRVWKGDLNMSGNAEISGGAASASANVWVVCSDMTMTDNAVVYGSGTTGGNAINIAPYGAKDEEGNVTSATVISTLTLSGNATVKNREGSSNNSIGVNWTLNDNADATDDACGVLYIDNGWTGEAHFLLYKNNGVAEGATKSTLVTYSRGAAINDAHALCGELKEDGSFVKGGTFSGKLYYSGNTGVIGADGVLTLGTAAIVGATGESWYLNDQAALDAYYANGSFDKGEYLLVSSNVSLTMAGDAYIEGRGYTVTVNGTGTLYALDRANDDYEGYGRWNVAGEVTVADEATNPVNGNRYITIQETRDNETFYSAHRVEMILTHVTLRAQDAGMYYKAEYKCDTALAGRVKGYGVVLSVDNMPGADFQTETGDINKFTVYDGSTFTPNADHTLSDVTSGAVFNVINETNGSKVNYENATKKVYANPYLAVDKEGNDSLEEANYFVGDTVNGNTTNGVSFSLLDVVDAIDNKWNEEGFLTAEKKAMVKDCVETWSTWFDAEEQSKLTALLTNIFAE